MERIQAPVLLSSVALFAALCSGILACSTPAPPPGGVTEAESPAERAEGSPKEEKPREPDGAAATIYLIGLESSPGWKRAKSVSGSEIIGCNDYLVPVKVKVGGGSPEALAEAALNKLLSLSEAEISAFGYDTAFEPSALKASVGRKPDGKLVIDLKGRLTAAGVCTVPRMKSQIERTAGQFGQSVIYVNGSEAEWRCFGNESGACR